MTARPILPLFPGPNSNTVHSLAPARSAPAASDTLLPLVKCRRRHPGDETPVSTPQKSYGVRRGHPSNVNMLGILVSYFYIESQIR